MAMTVDDLSTVPSSLMSSENGALGMRPSAGVAFPTGSGS